MRGREAVSRPAPSLLYHSLPKGEALQGDLLPYQRVGLCWEPGLDAGCEEPGIWRERDFADQVQGSRSSAGVFGISAQLSVALPRPPFPLGVWGKGLTPYSTLIFTASKGTTSFPSARWPLALSSPPCPLTLTFGSQVELSELAEDTLGGEVHVAGGQAGVVAQV